MADGELLGNTIFSANILRSGSRTRKGHAEGNNEDRENGGTEKKQHRKKRWLQ